jgi:hypothetical protein
VARWTEQYTELPLTKNTEAVARLGEAWRFRRTFERGQALMNAQDAWCLKAQAAAATGKLSFLEGEDFPSEIELDVIVGIQEITIALILQVYFEGMFEVFPESVKMLIMPSECTLLRGYYSVSPKLTLRQWISRPCLDTPRNSISK